MRINIVGSFLGVLFLPLLAAEVQSQSLAVPPEVREAFVQAISSTAEGCTTTRISCPIPARGTLKAGDCTLDSDGTHLDVFTFSGIAGQIVEIALRPISSTFTRPVLALAPPRGDASKTPVVFGGEAVTINYLLSSTGDWVVGVGTQDLFALGDYLLSVRCFTDSAPGEPQNCVTQPLLCGGQTATWELTGSHCRFSSGNQVFAEYEIYGVAGDVISFEAGSNAFRPLVGIYSENSGLLASTQRTTTSTAGVTYAIPSNAFYYLVVSSSAAFGTGFFTATASCGASGCFEPLVYSQPQAQSVKLGELVNLAVGWSGSRSNTRTEWYEGGVGDESTLVGTGTTARVGPIRGTTLYWAKVINPCGFVRSNSATITVKPPARKRAVVRR